MKFKEIKDMTVEELKKKEREFREELFQSRMKNSLGQLGSPIAIRDARRNVAKVKTALEQKLSR